MHDASDGDVRVFVEALQLPVGEREVFLLRACNGDEVAWRRLKGLLQAHEQAAGFMEEPPADVVAGIDPVGEKPGDHVGRYKLLQQIGEGGCGVVFMAEQEEPVRRKVALKIIKPGMDTRSVIARFEAERQALALMDHPNIAKVFDAGATKSGRPFFVMELIRGVKITEYCDLNSLPTEDRLQLFVQVCQAVQHAHQKGIIHRDIKPSNILVTSTEQGAAQPVVIDFGIAKATTNQRLTEKTLFTAFEMLLGTPAYMSPEQAAFTNVDVDTRTDIYGLGVLLYELLTGSTPFNATKLLQAGFDEIRRVIREDEPARPSTRLSTMAVEALMTVAERRRSEPPGLIRAIRGDLDWIVMKALEKDRSRRYETANGLALDVKRYLVNETVSARPPSNFYKLRKTVQRNKLLFASIGLITALLVVSLVVVMKSLSKERRARLVAQTEEARSRLVTRFLKNTLEGVGPSAARGRDTVMLRELLDRTAGQLRTEITNQPAVEAEIRGIVGPLYLELGNYEQAESMARSALALRRKLNGPSSAEAGVALNDLGLALWKQRKLPEAESSFQEALAIRRKLSGNEHPDVAATLNLLGAVYRRQRKLAESEALTREGLEIRRRLFGDEHLDVADSLRNLSIIVGERGNRAESESAAREMLAMRRRLLGDDHPLVALGLVDLAWVLGGKFDEAASLEMEAFGIQWKILADEHPDLARAIYLQGERLRARGKLAESHAVLNAALTLQRRILGDEHPDVSATMRGLCAILEQEGNWGELDRLYRDVSERRQKRKGLQNPQPDFVIESLVRVLRKQNKLKEAEQLLGEMLSPSFVTNPASAALLKERTDLLGRQGRWDEAALSAARYVEHQPGDYFSSFQLAALLVKTRNRPAYDSLCNRLLAAHANETDPKCAERVALACILLPDSTVNLELVDKLADTAVTLGVGDLGTLPYFHVCKAVSSYRLRRYADALMWAEKALDKTPAYTGGLVYAILAMSHWQQGDRTGALAMLSKAEGLMPAAAPEPVTGNTEKSWVAWLASRIVLDEAKALIDVAETAVPTPAKP